jgi:tetratricopeptide (TPR) repeat protein
VRMLLDRGLLVQDGPVYAPVGEIGELEVPETLHALIAARLDGLSPEERRVLGDGAVLGKMFTRDGVQALSGLGADAIEPLLSSLVRKEVLAVQADPRSPEHGQYGFLQDLVRHVAYETLSRHERRARHLTAAEFLRTSFPDEDEIAEVVAAHYVDAFEANPEAPDAADVRRRAHEALVRAGDRAQSLAAAGEAQRYLVQAADLTDETRVRAGLFGRAGWLAYGAADFETAERLLREGVSLYRAEGETHAAAQISSRLAFVVRWQGRFDEGLAMLEEAYDVLKEDEPDEDLGLLMQRLGVAYVFAGDLNRARERLERAADIGEGLGSAMILGATFNSRGILAAYLGRQQERLAMLRQAREIAFEHDLEALGSIYFNLSDAEFFRDQYEDALGYLEQSLALSRRRGTRLGEWASLAEMTWPLLMLGRWDEALERAGQIPEDRLQETTTLSLLESVVLINIARGDPSEARRILGLYPETSTDVQERNSVLVARACVLRAEGRREEALGAALECLEAQAGGTEAGVFSTQHGKQSFQLVVEVLVELGRRDEAAEWIARCDRVPQGVRPPFVDAQAHRLRALLDGDPVGFATAASAFDELRIPFWAAVARLERAELLEAGEEREQLLAAAGAEFERLAAKPWLDRVEAARSAALATAHA